MRTITIILMLALFSISATAQQLIDTWPISIKFEKTSMDVGKVKKGTVQRYNFPFTNNGKETVQINPYKGGTEDINIILPEPVKPGAKAKVIVEFSASGTGNFRKKIELTLKGYEKTKALEIFGSVH